MPSTSDTTIIAHALGMARTLARQIKLGTKPADLKEIAAQAEVDFEQGLEALRRVEGAGDITAPLILNGQEVGRVTREAAAEMFAGAPAGMSIGAKVPSGPCSVCGRNSLLTDGMCGTCAMDEDMQNDIDGSMGG